MHGRNNPRRVPLPAWKVVDGDGAWEQGNEQEHTGNKDLGSVTGVKPEIDMGGEISGKDLAKHFEGIGWEVKVSRKNK